MPISRSIICRVGGFSVDAASRDRRAMATDGDLRGLGEAVARL